ncbi:MAG: tetratricopeptide repeat protein [Planctomycetaceae bacterium]|jgi:tetratricopeptide (TPR) repeat protein|nr:tetratricopeptide repeat protein [Planctomycetaceae bacterium]
MSGNYFWATLSFVLFTCCHVVSLFGVTEFKVSHSENLYGKGVHTFFDKDYAETIKLLTQVEQLGSEDPRPYYFLALAHSRLKQNDKAVDYFKKAARLERKGQSVRDYNVSEALRRIQGNERLHVERYRNQAKLDWQQAEKRKRDILYANEKADEKRILTEIAKHPVVVAPFGAQSIDPLGTGKKIEVPILEASDSQPKKELSPAEETVPSNSTENTNSDDKKSDDKKSDDKKVSDTTKDDENPFDNSNDQNNQNTDDEKNETNNMTTSEHSDNNSKKDENKKEEEEEDDPFK